MLVSVVLLTAALTLHLRRVQALDRYTRGQVQEYARLLQARKQRAEVRAHQQQQKRQHTTALKRVLEGHVAQSKQTAPESPDTVDLNGAPSGDEVILGMSAWHDPGE